MGMVLFGALFPEVARKETRTLAVLNRLGIPPGTYGLLELFCIDHGCDCRRVMLNVVAESSMRHLATINYAFDADDDMRGPFLDQLNAQSEFSLALLDLVREHIAQDADYVKRLERHYRIVKTGLADPEHPIHKRLPPREPEGKELAEFLVTMARMAATTGRNDPCPCGAVGPNGRRRKFKSCCLVPLARVGPSASGGVGRRG